MKTGGRRTGRTVRIAHAYGNRRHAIEAALAADVDLIEADLWFRDGEVWARHERRLGPIPLLFDRRSPGVKQIGPWAMMFTPIHYLRLDVKPLTLSELLERTAGGHGLFLDLKGNHRDDDARAYAERLAEMVTRHGRQDSVIVCGQTDVLDTVRQVAPEIDVRYSIERQRQWDAFLRRLEADGSLRGVSMSRKFLQDDIVRFLESNGLEVFCWTVDDLADAKRLIALGVDGIISNNLEMLERLDEA